MNHSGSKSYSKIVVFGSFVTDLTARAARLPMPGETVQGKNFCSGPGGKGSNQAVAAHRAGAPVTLITRLGEDDFGAAALAFYESEGMPQGGIVRAPGQPTGAALIVVDEASGQNQIVVSLGACGHFTAEDLRRAAGPIGEAGILLAQLETNREATAEALRIAKARGVYTILNPAPASPLPAEMLADLDAITPNESEAAALTGVRVDATPASARAAAAGLMERGVRRVIITLGKRGIYAAADGGELFFPALDFGPVADTTGAGDAFNGGFAAALSGGLGFFDAAKFASVVSGLAVTKRGTAPAMPHKEQILAACQRLGLKHIYE